MNSCTLTSKKIKRNIFFSLFLVFLGFVVFDVVLDLYMHSRTKKDRFINEKASKIKHFNLNYSENRDYVFIGSSRTLYHISTEIFKENNLNIYNLGVSGNFLIDYPSYIYEAIKQKPKNIIISLSKKDLFIEKENVFKTVLYEDLFFYKKYGSNDLFISSLFSWIKSLHSFYNYSEAIFLKIKSFYSSFNLKSSEVQIKKYTNDIKSDCSIFKKVLETKKIILKCTNGDEILLGTNTDHLLEKQKYSNINKDTIKILNSFISIIKANDINPIVIFEPTLSKSEFDENIRIDSFLEDVEIIDLTQMHIQTDMWADVSHFNNIGRTYYSRELAKRLLRDHK